MNKELVWEWIKKIIFWLGVCLVLLGLLQQNQIIEFLTGISIDLANIFVFVIRPVAFIFLVCVYLSPLVQLYRISKIMFAISEKCDPVRFIELNNRFFGNKKSQFYQQILKLHNAYGYFYLGEREQAIQLTNSIQEDSIRYSQLKILYLNLNATICIDQREFDKARQYLHALSTVKSRWNKREITLLLELNHAIIDAFSGKLEQSYQTLQRLLPLVKHRLNRLETMFTLAHICLEQNNPQEARKYLEMVSREGNKLEMKSLADKKLESLSINNGVNINA